MWKKQLQAQLDRFVIYYNDVRPHRATGRRTPSEVYAAWEEARPSGEPIDLGGGRKLRHDRLDGKGTVTLRINRQMHHVPCGRQFAGLRVPILVDGLDVRVIGVDGQPVRNSSSTRQRTTNRSGGSESECLRCLATSHGVGGPDRAKSDWRIQPWHQER